VKALVEDDVAEPRMREGWITVGGEDEAWLYRQAMRETWQATPDALEHLRRLPRRKGTGRRGKRAG
jgi:hypothetical protein